MKVLSALVLSVLLSGCVVYPAGYVQAPPAEVVVYEPDVIVGGIVVGTYREGFGFWTGYGWDIDFYAYGHPGWGHYYRGAPHGAWHAYRTGPHWHRR